MQTTELLEHFDPATDLSEAGEADFMPACIAGCEVDVEADLEAAFVDLVRSSWNNPAVVIAFKDAVASAQQEV
jgi:hypothetical protein